MSIGNEDDYKKDVAYRWDIMRRFLAGKPIETFEDEKAQWHLRWVILQMEKTISSYSSKEFPMTTFERVREWIESKFQK